MPRLPQNSAGGPPASESSGRVRHLYVIEMLLGAGLLLLVIGIFVANNGPPKGSGGNIVTLTTANWQTEVARSPVPVVVDFWAPWCGPCVELSPIVEKIAGKYAGKIKVGKLNIDDAPEIAQRYGIESIPAVYIFKGGDTPRKTVVGLGPRTQADIVSAIDRVLE